MTSTYASDAAIDNLAYAITMLPSPIASNQTELAEIMRPADDDEPLFDSTREFAETIIYHFYDDEYDTDLPDPAMIALYESLHAADPACPRLRDAIAHIFDTLPAI